LSKQVSLSGIVKGKAVNRRDKLKKILTNNSRESLINMYKETHYFIRDIK